MKKLVKFVLLPLAAMSAVAAAIAVTTRRQTTSSESPKLKTIDDIKPPIPRFTGYDELKAKPTTHAHNHRADLLAESIYLGTPKEVNGDCLAPCVPTGI